MYDVYRTSAMPMYAMIKHQRRSLLSYMTLQVFAPSHTAYDTPRPSLPVIARGARAEHEMDNYQVVVIEIVRLRHEWCWIYAGMDNRLPCLPEILQ